MLIDHYEKCIAEVEKYTTLSIAEDFLCSQNVEYGLCSCSLYMFDVNLRGCEYIESFTVKSAEPAYLAKTPAVASSIKEMVYLLGVRLDFLKNFKTENNGCTNDSGIGE